jgi:hypothetical protein
MDPMRKAVVTTEVENPTEAEIARPDFAARLRAGLDRFRSELARDDIAEPSETDEQRHRSGAATSIRDAAAQQ